MNAKLSPQKLFFLTAFLPGVMDATVVLDGMVGGGEGYTHLTEYPFAGPVPASSSDPSATSNSDFIGETASRFYYDPAAGFSVNLGADRADIQQFHVTWDATNLYLSLSGPTIGYNSWNGPDGSRSNEDGDQGDIWIAIDTNAVASGNLAATATPQFNTEGVRAVDFEGWSPTHMIGVQYVNNGGGGTGWAILNEIGVGNSGAEGHGIADGGFDWQVDTGGNGYEFQVPWSALGFTGPPVQEMRFSAYTTQNDGGWDVYDSGPGTGNGGPFEQIGDFLGDTDTGLPGTDADNDGAVVGFAPGSNLVDLTGYVGPSHADEVDTIGEYWAIQVPEPTTGLLILLSGLGLLRRRR